MRDEPRLRGVELRCLLALLLVIMVAAAAAARGAGA
jgi:hypothetical protein